VVCPCSCVLSLSASVCAGVMFSEIRHTQELFASFQQTQKLDYYDDLMAQYSSMESKSEAGDSSNFSLKDYAHQYTQMRDQYLVAARALKMASGPYKASRDAYVAAGTAQCFVMCVCVNVWCACVCCTIVQEGLIYIVGAPWAGRKHAKNEAGTMLFSCAGQHTKNSRGGYYLRWMRVYASTNMRAHANTHAHSLTHTQ